MLFYFIFGENLNFSTLRPVFPFWCTGQTSMPCANASHMAKSSFPRSRVSPKCCGHTLCGFNKRLKSYRSPIGPQNLNSLLCPIISLHLQSRPEIIWRDSVTRGSFHLTCKPSTLQFMPYSHCPAPTNCPLASEDSRSQKISLFECAHLSKFVTVSEHAQKVQPLWLIVAQFPISARGPSIWKIYKQSR